MDSKNLDNLRAALSLLPVLQAPSSVLRASMIRLANTKAIMDELGSLGFVDVLDQKFNTPSDGVNCPHEFLLRVLPFLDKCEAEKTTEELYNIPTELCVGANLKKYVKPVDQQETDRLVSKVLQIAVRYQQGYRSHTETPDYVWLPELGLAYAHEGKNRVSLFRWANEPYIPTPVSIKHYPAPSRIRVYSRYKRGEKSMESVAVLDNTWASILGFPDITLDILGNYGVQHTLDWPDWLPPYDDMLNLAAWGSAPYYKPTSWFALYRQSIQIDSIQNQLQHGKNQAYEEDLQLSGWQRLLNRLK